MHHAALQTALQDPSTSEEAAIAAVDAELDRMRADSMHQSYSLASLETSALIAAIVEDGTPALLAHVLRKTAHLSITYSCRGSCFQNCSDLKMASAAIRELQNRGIFSPDLFIQFLQTGLLRKKVGLLTHLLDWYLSHGIPSHSVLKFCLQRLPNERDESLPLFARIFTLSISPDTLQCAAASLSSLTWKQIALLKSVCFPFPPAAQKLALAACESFPERSYLLQESAHARIALQMVLCPGTERLLAAPWDDEKEASGEIIVA